MPGMTLPPGFRFHPTDEELVAYYLKKRVRGAAIEFDVIADVDLYKCEPWDLPSKSLLPSSDAEWFFFSPRDRKYPNGSRTNRATEAGYWKATGRDRFVKTGSKTIGMKKTLVFYLGRAPQGERTDWLMHEYRLEGEEGELTNLPKEAFVLCRVFKKNGLGPPKAIGENAAEDGTENPEPPVEERNPVFEEIDQKPNLLPLPPPLAFAPAVQETAVKEQVDNYSVEEAGNVPFTSSQFYLDDVSKLDWESICLMEADGSLVTGSTDATRAEFNKTWTQEQVGGETLSTDTWNLPMPKFDEQPVWQLPPFESGFDNLELLPPLEEPSPSPPTLYPSLEEEIDYLAETPQPVIQIRPRPAVAALVPIPSGPWTAKRRVYFQKRGILSLSGSEDTETSSARLYQYRQEPQLAADAGLEASAPSECELDGNQPNAEGEEESGSPAQPPSSPINRAVDKSRISAICNTVDCNSGSSGPESVLTSVMSPPRPEDLDAEKVRTFVSSDSADMEQQTGRRVVESVQNPLPAAKLSGADPSIPSKSSFLDQSLQLTPVAGLLRILGSVRVEPGYAAEYSSSEMKLKNALDIPPAIGSIHVNSVTITCSCDEINNQPSLKATVCKCYGDCSRILPGPWEKNHEATGLGSEDAQRRARGRNSRNGGFVCVFFMGAISACLGFCLYRGIWRMTRQILRSGVLIVTTASNL